MIDTIQKLYDDAAIAANLKNGLVVQSAFMAASVCCPRCHFPENYELFSYLITRYADERLNLHRLKRHWRLRRGVLCENYGDVEEYQRALDGKFIINPEMKGLLDE